MLAHTANKRHQANKISQVFITASVSPLLLSITTIIIICYRVIIVNMSGQKEQEQKFSHTVMPKEDTKQELTGAPGIQIPVNPEEIKEFAITRDVDPKKLNEDIAKAEAEKKKKQ